MRSNPTNETSGCESPLDVVDSRSQSESLKLGSNNDKLTRKVGKRSMGASGQKFHSKSDKESTVQHEGNMGLTKQNNNDDESNEAIDLESTNSEAAGKL